VKANSKMKFVASRLSGGNTIFPKQIIIMNDTLTIITRGHREEFTISLPMLRIDDVDVVSPKLGFSTLHFKGAWKISPVHGFTKRQCEEILAVIDTYRIQHGKFRESTIEELLFMVSLLKNLNKPNIYEQPLVAALLSRIESGLGTARFRT
jgi:hypothetical protein